MSSGIDAVEPATDTGPSAPDRDWVQHRSALRMPELRSALEQLHAHLESFLKDVQAE